MVMAAVLLVKLNRRGHARAFRLFVMVVAMVLLAPPLVKRVTMVETSICFARMGSALVQYALRAAQ